MNNEIAVVLGNIVAANQMKEIIFKKGLSYSVDYAIEFPDLLRLAKNRISEGAKVIISRGGAAEYLREHLNVMITNIKYNYFDIEVAVRRALCITENIAVLGFYDAAETAIQVRQLTGTDFEVIRFEKQEEVDSAVRDLAQKGVSLLVGGGTFAEVATKYGLPIIFTGGTESDMLEAITEAQHNIKVQKEREEYAAVTDAILNNIDEGLVHFDISGNITLCNYLVNTLVKERNPHEKLQHIHQLLPELDLEIIKMSSHPLPTIFSEIGQRAVTADIVPIPVDGKVTGAVCTIQKISHIESLENKIRQKFREKGYIAKNTFDDIIGSSSTMTQLKDKARKYTQSDSSILIIGETGTGKEIFAQSIHNASQRKHEPFVAINCATLPVNIVESELFGYDKGAFTGALKEGKQGIFEKAHKGTIFLDEVAELPIDIQARLLRVLQEREIVRVGGDRVITVDVRIIAATNCNLRSKINDGLFREDLFYRLCVLVLVIPPLRQRGNDIIELAEYYVAKKQKRLMKNIIGIEKQGHELLLQESWPGNIRQLSNVIERAMIICETNRITADNIFEALQDTISGKADIAKKINILESDEKERIRRALDETKGKRKEAAKILNISTSTLWRKINLLREDDESFPY